MHAVLRAVAGRRIALLGRAGYVDAAQGPIFKTQDVL